MSEPVRAGSRYCADGKAFYGTKMSENMTRTKEGFLICRNVPIAKTGEQRYYGHELGLSEYDGDLVTVKREESEVFDPAAVASFEGKPFTDGHPPVRVDSDNYAMFCKGHITNVRRGDGENSDKLIADIVIYDKLVISEIENGKREISCGYDCKYVISEDGQVYQTAIRGNHAALVDEGRAGEEVSIKDQKPGGDAAQEENHTIKNQKGEREAMKEKSKKTNLIGTILKKFSQDAEPDEIAAVVELLSETPDEEPRAQSPAAAEPAAQSDNQPTNTDSDVLTQILETVKGLQSEIASLKAKDSEASDPIEQLETELAGDADSEEDVTKPVEEMDEEGALDDEPKAEDDSGRATSDTNAMLAFIKAMKPVIANTKDEKAKRLATDAITNFVRSHSGRSKSGQTDGYAGILKAKQNAAIQRATDSASKANVDERALGRSIAASRNPHYKPNKEE